MTERAFSVYNITKEVEMTAFFPDEDQTDVPPGLTAAVNRLLADPSASNAGEICAEIADIVTNAHPSVREIEIHADDLGEKFMMTVGLPELPEESGGKKQNRRARLNPPPPRNAGIFILPFKGRERGLNREYPK